MNTALIVLLVLLVLLLMIGVPVGFAIGGATMVAMFYCSDLNMVVNAQYCYSGIFSFTVMAIPFFMLAGSVISTGGIAKRIVEFASALVDFLTGALGCVSMLACMFFGALSGSGMATTAAIGGMMIPEMKKRGYDPSYAATLVCFGGTVGPIIPPSLSFVLYGATTKTSVPDLFKAGILPGIIIGLTFLVVNIIICKRTGTDLPVRSDEKKPLKEALVARLKRLGKATKDGFWALLSPVIILGGIYSGIFTATEAGVVATVYGIVIGKFVYKELSFAELWKMYKDNVPFIGGMMFVFAPAASLGAVFAMMGVTDAIQAFFLGISNNLIIVMIPIFILLFIVGMFVQTTPAIVIFSPILLPIVESLGMDPIQFGLVMDLSLAIAFVTPPVAANLFVATSMTGLDMLGIVRKAVPFIIMLAIAMFAVAYIPAISMGFLHLFQ